MYLILLSVKQGGIEYHFFFKVWLDLGLNPGLPDHWWTLYPLVSQISLFFYKYRYIKICIYVYMYIYLLFFQYNFWKQLHILVCQYFYSFYYLFLESFSLQYVLMVFHWSLSDSKSPQVSRTFLSILAGFTIAVVWMVSTCPPSLKSSSPFNIPSVTVSNTPITIGIIITFMFHSFFQFPIKVCKLILFTFFQFYFVVSRDSKVGNFSCSLFFWLITLRSSLLAEIRWSVCMSKSYWSLLLLFLLSLF